MGDETFRGVSHWVDSQSSSNPDGIAITTADETLTWRALAEARDHTVRAFVAAGLQPGDRVLIQLPNVVQTVLVYLACFRLGVLLVAAHRRLTALELAQLAADVTPALFVGVARTGVAPLEVIVDVAETALTVSVAPVVSARSVADDDRVQSWSAFLAQGRPVVPFPAAPRASSAAILLPTSGTTGRPKLVAHTHASLAAQGSSGDAVGLRSGDRLLGELPLVHSSGLFVLLLALRSGLPLTLLDFEPVTAAERIERDRCSWIGGLPLIIDALAREQQRAPRDLSSVRAFAIAGDVCPQPVLDRIESTFHVRPGTFWGATEANGALGCGHASTWSAVPATTEVRIVDGSGRPVSPGETGELWLRSPCIAAGYWRGPNQIDRFRNSWLPTGDLMSVDGAEVRFRGRSKDLIVTDAVNVSPVELEAVLTGDPDVVSAGVAGLPDALHGQRIVAAVVLAEGVDRAVVLQRLWHRLRTALSEPKRPQLLHAVADVPRNGMGKIDRRRLARDLAALGGSETSASLKTYSEPNEQGPPCR